jgi:hypothetical protein
MEAPLAHPPWIVAGILLVLVGALLFRWGRRNDTSAAIASAGARAALNRLRGKKSTAATGADHAGVTRRASGVSMAVKFRNSMAQFLGIVGILMMLAGLTAVVFGMFYVSG